MGDGECDSHNQFEIVTERLTLRPWRPTDADAFAAMNTDPDVMADLGGPLSRSASDAKLERFTRSYEEHQCTRWVVLDRSGTFLGYTGAVLLDADHPLGKQYEIGWRLRQAAWRSGFAVEAAAAALGDLFDRLGAESVVAYTSPDNARSQAVMRRLDEQPGLVMVRQPDRDFIQTYEEVGEWTGWVWEARQRPERSASAGE